MYDVVKNVKKYDRNEYPGDGSVDKFSALEAGVTVKAGYGGSHLQQHHGE